MRCTSNHVTHPAGLRGLAVAMVMVVAAMWQGRSLAAEPTGLDVVVVLDVSGSMKTHDPRRLSQFAVEVLTAFLGDGDRIGLVPLGGDAAPLPLAPVTEAREALPGHLEGLAYGGGTPCDRALEAADKLLDSATSDPARQVVVFLTDGVCHEGAADKRTRDESLLARATAMGGRGRRIFGIPLGPEADLALVSSLTALSETDFSPSRVDDARQLPAQFARLSALFRGTEARQLPLARGPNTLEVDPYVRRLTLLGTADRAPLALSVPTPPEGASAAALARVASGRFPKAGASWSGWSTLHLDRPDAGAWRLDASEAGAAVIVYDYDLSPTLVASRRDGTPLEGGVAAGETMRLEATLVTPQGEPVTAAFLAAATVRLDVRAPGETEWRTLGAMTPDSAGRLVQETAFQALGRHLLRARIVRGESLDLTAWLPLSVGPVLTLPSGATDERAGGLRCLDPDGENRFDVVLKDALGAPLASNDGLLTELDLSLWAGPGEAAETPLSRVALFAKAPDAPGAFTARWKPPAPGPWRTELRAVSAAPSPRGGNLDLRVPGPPAFAPTPRLSVEGAAPALALRPGDEVRFTLTARNEGASPPLTYRADLSGLSLPSGVTAGAETTGDTVAVTVRASEELPADGPISGVIRVVADGPCVSGLDAGTIALAGSATTFTFWEAWGDLILAAIVLFILLLIVLKVVRCRSHTYSFRTDPMVTYGPVIGADDETQFRPAAGRTSSHDVVPRRVLFGCRSARIHWFQSNDAFQRQGDGKSFFLEACPGGQIQLVTRGAMVELWNWNHTARLPKPDQPASGVATLPLRTGVTYRIGNAYFSI